MNVHIEREVNISAKTYTGKLRKVDIIDFLIPIILMAVIQIPIMATPIPVHESNRSVIKVVVSNIIVRNTYPIKAINMSPTRHKKTDMCFMFILKEGISMFICWSLVSFLLAISCLI